MLNPGPRSRSIAQTTDRRHLRSCFILAAASGLAIFALVRFVPRDHWFFEASCILVGVSGVVLVLTVPICFLTLIGRPPVMTLTPLIPSSRQRARWREMRRRPELTDSAFYRRFYSHLDVPEDVPLRLRAVYAEQLGLGKVFPEDRATDFDEQLDFGELLSAVAEEFGVEFSEEQADRLAADGTFDALVRHLADKPIYRQKDLRLPPAGTDLVAKALRRRRIGIFIGLLVVGLLTIGLGFLIGRLEQAVPGLALAIKLLGMLLVLLALARGDYRGPR